MVERLGWTLVHSVWEGVLVALLLALALLATRRSPAGLRYALACLALATMAGLPIATYHAFAPVGSSAEHSASLGWRLTPGEAMMPRPAAFSGLLPLFVRAWLLGVVVLSVRLLGALVHVERWRRRHARPATPDWQDRIDALARRLGIGRRIALLVSERIGVPSAWGAIRPFVVLPTSLVTGLPPAEVETILLHELAHIRRHDYLVNLLQTVVETALFYHPAVWWVSAVVRREREHCCDDVVVGYLADPIPYARALLHLEERRLTLPHPTLSAKGSNLMNRIARILGTQPAPSRLSPLASALAAVGVLGAVLGGALQAHAQSTAPKSPKTPVAAPPSKPLPTARGHNGVHGLTKTQRDQIQAQLRAVQAQLAQARAQIASARAQVASVAPGKAQALAAKAVVEAHAAQARANQAQARLDILATVAAQGRKGDATVAPKTFPGKVPVLGDLPIVNRLFATGGPKTSSNLTQNFSSRTTFGGGLSGGGQGGGFSGGGFSGGRGFGAVSEGLDESSITLDNGRVSIDVKDAPFASVMRRLAKKLKVSVVIVGGGYLDLTMVISDQDSPDAIEIVCKAAGATFRVERGVYYVTSKAVGTSGGGFGGG